MASSAMTQVKGFTIDYMAYVSPNQGCIVLITYTNYASIGCLLMA